MNNKNVLEKKKKKAIILSCFGWYSERLIYIEDYLKNKEYDVDIFLSDFNHSKKKHEKDYHEKKNIHYINVIGYKKNISFRRIISHFVFSFRAKKEIERIRPQLIYCVIPPNSLVKKMVQAKRKMHCVLIFDVIDVWPESFPNKVKNLLGVWKTMRDKYIGFADKIVLECEYYKECFGNDKLNTEVLRLVKQPIRGNIDIESHSEDLCLGYLGSINSLIDIDRICHLVSLLLKKLTVLIKIVGDGENRDLFVSRLEEVGANVKFYGKIFDEKELKKILGGCNFGINIYKQGLHIGLTTKSVSYFQLGIPILNSIGGDTYMIVTKYNAGINIDDYNDADIVSVIENYSTDVRNVFETLFSADRINERLQFLDVLC